MNPMRIFSGIGVHQVLINHGADEVVKAVVMLRSARFEVAWGLRVGFATKLLLITETVSIVLFSDFIRNGAVGVGGLHKFFRQAAGFAETVDFLQFFALRRVLLPVTRVADTVGFGRAFVYHSALFIAVEFAAVDGAVLGECAPDFLNGVLVNDFCHNRNVFIICRLDGVNVLFFW